MNRQLPLGWKSPRNRRQRAELHSQLTGNGTLRRNRGSQLKEKVLGGHLVSHSPTGKKFKVGLTYLPCPHSTLSLTHWLFQGKMSLGRMVLSHVRPDGHSYDWKNSRGKREEENESCHFRSSPCHPCLASPTWTQGHLPPSDPLPMPAMVNP